MTRYLSLIAIIMGVIFSACSDDNDGPAPDKVTLHTTELATSSAGGDFSFDVEATRRPSVYTDADWISLETVKSLGDQKYTISGTIRPNIDADGNTQLPREGKITVNAFNAARIVVVKQEGEVEEPINPGELGMKSSAMEIAKKISAAINIGNTMEATSGEGTWTTSKINKAYIRGLKAAGFDAVRLPCAWDSYVIDASKNTIDPAWLDRVYEVVGWIVAEDMYCVLNIHWDGGWLEDNINKGYTESINKKQHDFWTQIANKLNVFDEHLLFAGMNEPGMNNGVDYASDTNKKAYTETIMKYQQTFVDAVRATGGNNAVRVLISQAPGTNVDMAVKDYYSLPKDEVADRQMLEIHMYDPSDFTILEKGSLEGNSGGWSDYAKYYWGAQFHKEGDKHNCTWGEEDHIQNQFKKLKDAFVSKGIPVIVGEYSAMDRNSSAPDIDLGLFKQSRNYWTEFVTRTAKDAGCVPFYWETGGDVNRTNGSLINADVIDALMQGAAAGNYPF